MARRPTNLGYMIPGLFDEPGEGAAPMPVHPDIARHAERVKASGGRAQSQALGTDNDPLGVLDVRPVENRIRFMSFGSGSSGNAAYIGDDTSGFLIDAGVDLKRISDGLRANGISMDHVKGICITHDHGDHMRYAYTIVRKFRHIAIYCTPRVMSGILTRHNLSRRIKDYHVNIYKEFPFSIGNFTITAFDVMHDGSDNAGFYVEHDNRAFAIATDLGCISPRVDHYMRRADFIMIESNYDLDMLRNGNYPKHLKARIAADNGHLDNEVTARYLADIYTERLSHVFLCHLSHDNNTPELALNCSRTALTALGLTVGTGLDTATDRSSSLQLVALPRFECSPLYTFRKS